MTACSIEGCTRPVRALGWCDSHYQRHRRGQPVAAPLRSYGTPSCSVPGCQRRHVARGLCREHWRLERTPRRFRKRTAAEVTAMRQLHAQGVSFEELARRFDCAASTAARICKQWSFPDAEHPDGASAAAQDCDHGTS